MASPNAPTTSSKISPNVSNLATQGPTSPGLVPCVFPTLHCIALAFISFHLVYFPKLVPGKNGSEECLEEKVHCQIKEGGVDDITILCLTTQGLCNLPRASGLPPTFPKVASQKKVDP